MKRLVLILLCAVAFGQDAPWTPIINSTRATDWTHAGATIVNRTTICATVHTTDSTVTINNAIAACASGGVVLFADTGTYNVTGLHDYGHSGITLRGVGPLLTTIKVTGSDNCNGAGFSASLCIQSNPYTYNGGASVNPGGTNACDWIAGSTGYAQGATTITLSSCGSAPPVNQFIVLDQKSDTTDNNGVFVCNVAACNNEGGLSQQGRTIAGNNHAQQEMVYVTAVSGSGSGPYTVTLAAPGLHMPNWSESGAFTAHDISAWWPGQIRDVGIENMTIDDASATGQFGIMFYDCYSCWISNVRELLGGSRSHIEFYQSDNSTLRDSYLYNSYGAEQSYGWECQECSNSLVENNIFDFMGFAITHGLGNGNVIGYNDFERAWFGATVGTAGMNWNAPPFGHNSENGMGLWEGNAAPTILEDDDWGTMPTGTIFRNRALGRVIGTQRGAYNSANNYNPWDIVTSAGNSYAATQYIASGTANSNPGNTNICPGSPGNLWRCWFILASDTFGQQGTSRSTAGVMLMWGARGWNVIGNVLGDPLYDDNYISSPTAGSTHCTTSGYVFGWRKNECAAGATDNIAQSSAMLWGNYIAAKSTNFCSGLCNVVRWDNTESSPGAIAFLSAQTTPASHTLPASFYLPSQPAFWTLQSAYTSSQPPFPAAGPDVAGGSGPGGFSWPIPAQVAFANGTFTNGVMNFDANQFYYGTPSGPAPSAGLPDLPQHWVNNNEAIDGTYPALSTYYELLLGGTTGTGSGAWCASGCTGLVGAPAACSSIFTTMSRYTADFTGKQNAIYDMEACRTLASVGFLVDQPTQSVQGAFNSVNSSVAAGVYYGAGGYSIPQSATAPANKFIIFRSTHDAQLQAMPMPVCAGGIQDNVSASTNPGLINADCKGDLLQYQLGHTVTTIPSGAFTLTNGTPTNTSNYNYLQHMYQEACTSTANCEVITSCDPFAGSNQCQNVTNGCTGDQCIGPDHWMFLDGAASMSTGNPSLNSVVDFSFSNLPVGSAFDTIRFASDIFFQRFWVHGDYLSTTSQADALSHGANVISVGFNFNTCKNCGLVDSQVSGALHPGEEGHAVNVSGMWLKVDHNWLEGQSSCAFGGGYSLLNGPPFDGYGSYVAFTDSEFRRNRCTFPYGWLGFNGTPGTPASYTSSGNNGWGHMPDANYYWGGAGDNYGQGSGTTPLCNGTEAGATCVNADANGRLTYVSGPIFHDANSSWGTTNYNIFLNGTGTSHKFALISEGNQQVAGAINNSINCTSGETVIQNVSGAVSILLGAVSGSGPMNMQPITVNSPKVSTTPIPAAWIGQTSGCSFLPTLGGAGLPVPTQLCSAWPAATSCPTVIGLGFAGGASPSSFPGVLSNVPFTLNAVGIFRKNGEELKECLRCLMDGNIVENVDNTGGQNGTVETNQIRNASGTGVNGGQNHQSTISSMLQSNTIMRSACRGPSIVGRSNTAGGGVSQIMNKNGFINDLLYDLSGANNGCPGGAGDTGIEIIAGGGGQNWNATVNASGGVSTAVAVASIDGGITCTGTTYPGTGGAGNITYSCPSTTAAVTAGLCGDTPTFTGNSIFVYGFGNAANNSTTAGFVCTASAVNSITLAHTGVNADTAAPTMNNVNPILANNNASIGFQVLGIDADSPAYLYNCTNAAMNMGSATINGHTVEALGKIVSTGSAHWNGTFTSANATISYPWATSGSDGTGTCILNNGQGAPRGLTIDHLTYITDANDAIGALQTLTNGPLYARYHTFRNSIVLSSGSPAAWYDNAIGEGTPTEQFVYDPTTMSAYKLVWPGRTASNYTGFGNNPFAIPQNPDGCAAGGCSETVGGASFYFPTTSCGIGFVYSCSGALPLIPPSGDYHQFGLASGSAYHSQGSDGLDIGAVISQIDAAQTANTYSCTPGTTGPDSPQTLTCNGPGPYPDFVPMGGGGGPPPPPSGLAGTVAMGRYQTSGTTKQ